jgi:hypothetical protein
MGYSRFKQKKFASVLRLAPPVVLKDVSGGMSLHFLATHWGRDLDLASEIDHSTNSGFLK